MLRKKAASDAAQRRSSLKPSRKKLPKSVTIKRVKRAHRRVSTKEKILGGLGVGTTLLGGMGAISAKPTETQFIRAAEGETGQKTGQLKEELQKLFGVPEARAEGMLSGDEEVEVLSEEPGSAIPPAGSQAGNGPARAANLSPAEAYHSPQVLAQSQNKNTVQTFALGTSPGFQTPAGGGAQYQGASAGSRTAEAEKTYTVKKGDTLWGISRKHYGDGRLWRNILDKNPASLSRSGNVRTLRIGYVLTIPNLAANGSAVKAYDAPPGAPAANSAGPSVVQTQSYSPHAAAQGNLNASPLGLNLRGAQGQQSSPAAFVPPAATGDAVNPANPTGGGQTANSPAAATKQTDQSSGGIIYKPSGSDVGDDDKEVQY